MNGIKSMFRAKLMFMLGIVLSIGFIMATPLSLFPSIGFGSGASGMALSALVMGGHAVTMILGVGIVISAFLYVAVFWYKASKVSRVSLPQQIKATAVLFACVLLLGLSYVWVLSTPF